MRDDPPQHPAEDVPAACVRRLDAVGDEERRGPAVLRDDLERHVVARVVAVGLARQALADLEHRTQQIGLEDVLDPLQQHRDAFERGTGVDVPSGQRLDEAQLIVDLVLDEHQVPDLHEPFLVHVGPALGSVLRAPIDEDLAARPTRACGMGVPVVRELAPGVDHPAADDPIGRQTDAVDPRGDRLVVLLEHRHPQPIVIDAVDLGDEVVRPRDRLGLEVVARTRSCRASRRMSRAERRARRSRCRWCASPSGT